MGAKIGDIVKITRGYDQKFEGMVGELLDIKEETNGLSSDGKYVFQVKLHKHNYVWCRKVEVVNTKNPKEVKK